MYLYIGTIIFPDIDNTIYRSAGFLFTASPIGKYLKNEGRDLENSVKSKFDIFQYSLQQIFQISWRWDLKSDKPANRNTGSVLILKKNE